MYAELGIPELWQYDGKRLAFKTLAADGRYRAVEQSVAFAGLASADLQPFLDRRGTIGENALEQELGDFIRAELCRKRGSRSN